MKYPWNAASDTQEITDIPPDIVLLAKMEALQLKIQDLKDNLKSSFKLMLIEQLSQREVGGSGFTRSNEILEKVKALLHEVSQVSSVVQASPGVPAPVSFEDPVEFGHAVGCVSNNEEQDIVLAINELEQMASAKRAWTIQQLTNEKLANCTIKVGFHHGHFNLLPAS